MVGMDLDALCACSTDVPARPVRVPAAFQRTLPHGLGGPRPRGGGGLRPKPDGETPERRRTRHCHVELRPALTGSAEAAEPSGGVQASQADLTADLTQSGRPHLRSLQRRTSPVPPNQEMLSKSVVGEADAQQH